MMHTERSFLHMMCKDPVTADTIHTENTVAHCRCRLCVQDEMSTSEVPTKLTPKSPPNTLSFAGTLTSAKFSFERKLGKFFCTDVFGVGPWKNM